MLAQGFPPIPDAHGQVAVVGLDSEDTGSGGHTRQEGVGQRAGTFRPLFTSEVFPLEGRVFITHRLPESICCRCFICDFIVRAIDFTL